MKGPLFNVDQIMRFENSLKSTFRPLVCLRDRKVTVLDFNSSSVQGKDAEQSKSLLSQTLNSNPHRIHRH